MVVFHSNSYNKTGCPARAQTEGDFVIKTTHEHSHDPDKSVIEAKRIRTVVKAKAKESLEEPRKIVGTVLTDVESTSARLTVSLVLNLVKILTEFDKQLIFSPNSSFGEKIN